MTIWFSQAMGQKSAKTLNILVCAAYHPPDCSVTGFSYDLMRSTRWPWHTVKMCLSLVILIAICQRMIQIQNCLKTNTTLVVENGFLENHIRAYNNRMKRCNQRFSETLCIIDVDSVNLLNKRNDLISKCRHESKFYIKNYKNESKSLMRTDHEVY